MTRGSRSSSRREGSAQQGGAGQSDRLWQSVEELSGLVRPGPGSIELGRREFLLGLSASLTLGTLAGCAPQPPEQIVPYVRDEVRAVPGVPLFFATALVQRGYAHGVLVESHLGRPTKVEGNPRHPASLGGTDVFDQAAILQLYNPARSQSVMQRGAISTWDDFGRVLRAEMARIASRQGSGLRLLTGEVASPTLAAQLAGVLAAHPGARWHRYEPVGEANARGGAVAALGMPLDVRCHFDRARRILALDCDFLSDLPGSVRYARDYADFRRSERDPANRLYVVEPSPSVTGAVADQRLPLRGTEVPLFAMALARGLGLRVPRPGGLSAEGVRWAREVAADLQRHRGSSLIVVGESQPAALHALGLAMNQTLGSFGATLSLLEPADGLAPGTLAELVDDLRAGRVEVLIMSGVNPVYDAPVDLEFARQLKRARLSVHHGLFVDETAQRCQWHLPSLHELERWGDARAFDGTVTIIQPLIAPLYEGRSLHQVLGLLESTLPTPDRDRVRGQWRASAGQQDFDGFWQSALQSGVMPGTARAVRTASVSFADVEQTIGSWRSRAAAAGSDALELAFRPDPRIWDGRFAESAWLQELPKPLSSLTWDNAALISPRLGSELGLEQNEVVQLDYRGRSLEVAVHLQPGLDQRTVSLSLGYGRSAAGEVGNGRGFNAYQLRRSDELWFGSGLRLTGSGKRQPLVVRQRHHSMQSRPVVREGHLPERTPRDLYHTAKGKMIVSRHSLYPEMPYADRAWGMMIDLTRCIGCGTCTIACQAENNIPSVGKRQMEAARDMHWIRVDYYYRSDPDRPEMLRQPVPCMQCENAPCEVVCPTGATQHSADGLNDMTYNRCIGTRYCSNNCPYKVRRFNFLLYTEQHLDQYKLLQNPEVTVRMRGVMEKCTYCVQRIRRAEIAAGRENRPVRDGEVVPACAQACPTRAITFGDLNDKSSRVWALRQHPDRYFLLEELNTQPRTAYLTVLRNRNPRLG